MANHHSQTTEFSGNLDDWEAYIEHVQLENYFMANDIRRKCSKKEQYCLAPVVSLPTKVS